MKGLKVSTINKILLERSTRSGDAIAIESPDGRKWTFSDLSMVAGGIASRLIESDCPRRYGIVMPNGPSLTLSILGAVCAGTAVPLNPLYQEQELINYFQSLRVSSVLLKGEHSAAMAAADQLGLPVIQISGEERGDLITTAKPNDVALVLMTSGSTGKPKAVPLTHKNLCVSASEVAQSLALGPEDVCLSMWEQHHIGGLVDLLLAPILSGGKIISAGGFNASSFFQLTRKHQPTWFQAVPTTLHEIMSWLDRQQANIDGHSLRFLRSVAAKLPEPLLKQVEEQFRAPVIQTFGMTEAGPLIASTKLPPALRKAGSVGTSCGNEIRIFGEAAKVCAPGKIGEIGIRGENVFSGYENADEENQARFQNGWFLTGDLGWLDEDGHLFLVGRSKHLVNRGGEKINPQEVEDVLHSHPAVRDAAAFAIKHRTLGEDIAAAVILKENASLEPAALRKHVSGILAPFKVPGTILFLDDLPLTGIGKVDRTTLAQLASDRAEDQKQDSKLSETERKLCRIWAEEMGLDAIGPEENFFTAGGDSLMGVRVMVAVEAWLGKPLAPELMMEISTVRNMAAMLIDQKQEESICKDTATQQASESHIIREMRMVMGSGQVPVIQDAPTLKAHPQRQDHGPTPPLYWCFNQPEGEMAKLSQVWKAEAPLIGMYSGGDGAEEVTREVAAHYAEVILQRCRGRSFFLGGNCRGARVVARIIELLREANVAPLAVVFLEHGPRIATEPAFPQLMLFGQKNWIPRKNRKAWAKLAKHPASQLQVANIKGLHGEFFLPQNVNGLESAIRTFIQPILQPALEA